MAVNVGDIMKCSVLMTIDDDVAAVNTYHGQFQGTGPIDEAVVTADWGNYIDAIYSPMLVQISDTFLLHTIRVVKYILPGGDTEFVGQLARTTQGQVTVNPPLTNGLAAQLTSNLSGAGRGQAKKFFPSFNQGTIDVNVLQSGPLSTLAAAGAAYFTNIGVGLEITVPGTYTEGRGFRSLQDVIAREKLGYQRRRKPGVGD